VVTLQRRFALSGWRCGRILGRGGAWVGLRRLRRLCGSEGRICPVAGPSAALPSGRLCWGWASVGVFQWRHRFDLESMGACHPANYRPIARGAAGCRHPAIGLFQNMDRYQPEAGPLVQASTGLFSGRICLPVRDPLSARPEPLWPSSGYG